MEEAFVEATALQFYGPRGFENEPREGCHTLVLRKGLCLLLMLIKARAQPKSDALTEIFLYIEFITV